jgi:hypothetical protein
MLRIINKTARIKTTTIMIGDMENSFLKLPILFRGHVALSSSSDDKTPEG